MKIPFAKPTLNNQELKAIKEVLDSGILVHGKKSKLFEQNFTKFTNSKNSTSVSSCTAGMHLFYFVNNIGKGDEVIVPSQTHVATAHAVELSGAKPVFVDSEIINGNIDISKTEKYITKKTKAIAIVHYLGVPVNMSKLISLAKKYKLLVVEDCALSLGSYFKKKHTGLHGDAGFFSFYPVKHITSGEGGMVISKNNQLIKKINLAKAFGVDKTHNQRNLFGMYDAVKLGFNYRMSEVHAAIGIEQLKKFNNFLKLRKSNFKYLSYLFSNTSYGRILNKISNNNIEYSPYCFTYILDKSLTNYRNKIIYKLKEKGIGSSIYYPKPVPLMTYYKKKYKNNSETYYYANEISNTTISLPIGPHVGKKELNYIYEHFSKILKNL